VLDRATNGPYTESRFDRRPRMALAEATERVEKGRRESNTESAGAIVEGGSWKERPANLLPRDGGGSLGCAQLLRSMTREEERAQEKARLLKKKKRLERDGDKESGLIPFNLSKRNEDLGKG